VEPAGDAFVTLIAHHERLRAALPTQMQEARLFVEI
jgi:hypothetical protein